MHEHVLRGCRPLPLASYLKALAVLKLVGEQADPGTRGFWLEDEFVLRTELDEESLRHFLLQDYRPTPIVAPWNGGSGFYAKDNQTAIEAIAASATERLEAYRHVIDRAKRVLSGLGVNEKVSDDDKRNLLEAVRARMPDQAVPWLDAAYALTAAGAKYPPLLGTGGNDGRLELTNNFMQRLLDLVDPGTGAPRPEAGGLLEAALFDATTESLTGGAIGQFLPSGAGGANAAAGFDGDSAFNPWDFVLMLEGAVLFSVATVRRLELDPRGALSSPFTVRASGSGYPSASNADEGASRGEMWLPLWERASLASEIRVLLAEGRARISGRTARNGVDFARAVATLGVDRGITEFQRYGFQVRNGRSYLAMDLGRHAVREQPSARLLDGIDAWLYAFRRRTTSKGAPASARRSLEQLDEAILDLTRRGGPDRVQTVLVALGACERSMARSFAWASDPKNQLSPVPPLAPDWLAEADDGSTEFRLAASLGSIHAIVDAHHFALRSQMEPVTVRWKAGRSSAYWEANAARDVVWFDGDLAAAMNAVLARRLTRFQQVGAATFPDQSRQPAGLPDVAAFIEGRVDDSRLARLLWGTILVDWQRAPGRMPQPSSAGPSPSALYGLLKLCFAGDDSFVPPIPIVPRIHRLAAAGNGEEATRSAARRLRASGLAPAIDIVGQHGDPVRRAAAALLFPLGTEALTVLRRAVLRPSEMQKEPAS